MLPVPGVVRTTLTRQRLSIAVGEHHRLARRDNVTLAELAGETIIVWGHLPSSAPSTSRS